MESKGRNYDYTNLSLLGAPVFKSEQHFALSEWITNSLQSDEYPVQENGHYYYYSGIAKFSRSKGAGLTWWLYHKSQETPNSKTLSQNLGVGEDGETLSPREKLQQCSSRKEERRILILLRNDSQIEADGQFRLTTFEKLW